MNIDDKINEYLKQNAKVVAYDNGGETMDRYTVIINNDAYGMSDNASSPQGFCQFIGEVGRDIKLGSHLGKKISMNKLPKEVQKVIKQMSYVRR